MGVSAHMRSLSRADRLRVVAPIGRANRSPDSEVRRYGLNLRRVAEAETLFVDPASGARTMLHELEGEVDVAEHTFVTAASTGDQGFYRNKRSRRTYENGRQA